jgi:hypothetical protein
MPVLSTTIINFETFMTDWEKLEDAHKILKPWTDIGLHWAVKYYGRMDHTEAYVLAMCKTTYSLLTALTTSFTSSPQSHHTLHMDQKPMG